MPDTFVQLQSPALLRRTLALANLPRSRSFYTLRQRIQGAVIRGNRTGLLAGTDGRGRPLIPLRSVRKGKYRGATGPPLAPFREGSRVISNFQAEWVQESGTWQLLMGWDDIVSVRGVPFLRFHLEGDPPLPKRNIAGIRPGTWVEIKRFYADVVPDLLREVGS